MKRIILATVAWTGLAAGAALADVQLPNQLPLSALETCPIVQAAVQQLQTEGYTGIVVHLATHHARVEATLGGEARMFRYECGQEGTRQAAVMFRDGGDDSVPFVDRTGAGDDGGKGGHGGNGPGRPHGGNGGNGGNGGTGAEPPETGSGSTSPEGGTGGGDTPTDQEGPTEETTREDTTGGDTTGGEGNGGEPGNEGPTDEPGDEGPVGEEPVEEEPGDEEPVEEEPGDEEGNEEEPGEGGGRCSGDDDGEKNSNSNCGHGNNVGGVDLQNPGNGSNPNAGNNGNGQGGNGNGQGGNGGNGQGGNGQGGNGQGGNNNANQRD